MAHNQVQSKEVHVQSMKLVLDHTLHPTPYTLHPTPHTPHPTTNTFYILHQVQSKEVHVQSMKLIRDRFASVDWQVISSPQLRTLNPAP